MGERTYTFEFTGVCEVCGGPAPEGQKYCWNCQRAYGETFAQTAPNAPNGQELDNSFTEGGQLYAGSHYK